MERKKRKGKEKAPAETITYCKKNDGKGWHCKRPAQLPHSFCSYHLAQTRAYSSGHRASTTDHASEAATAAETRAEGGDSNNWYYYYEGFGPWRGKKRGRALIVSAKVREEEKEDGRTSVDRGRGDDDDNVVAGDDEYDLDCFDEDDHDNDCNSMSHQHKIYKENGKKNEVDPIREEKGD